ncbi:MAG TPA: PAS domain S-box protein, partial [Ilumatobacteraceae bacterium]
MFESIPEMVVVVDLDGTILYANAHSSDLVGWPAEELIGQKVEVLLPAALHDVHRAHRKTYNHSPKSRPMGSGLLLSALHRSGREVPVEIALSPLEGEIA